MEEHFGGEAIHADSLKACSMVWGFCSADRANNELRTRAISACDVVKAKVMKSL